MSDDENLEGLRESLASAEAALGDYPSDGELRAMVLEARQALRDAGAAPLRGEGRAGVTPVASKPNSDDHYGTEEPHAATESNESPSGNPDGERGATTPQRQEQSQVQQRQRASEAGRRVRGRPHPANRYVRTPPDFAALAERYPWFAPYVSVSGGRGRVDFRDWAAARALARVLFEHDFGVRGWDVPTGHLVPALTNRLNYICWIRDLLHLSRVDRPVSEAAVGLDIGCGANLVYPLLGAAEFGWSFVAVDVSAAAVAAARATLAANPRLAARIVVRPSSWSPVDAAAGGASEPQRPWPTSHTAGRPRAHGGGREHPSHSEEDRQGVAREAQAEAVAGGHKGEASAPILAAAVASGDGVFDFTICNPPFFSRLEDAKRGPQASYGGTAGEMVTPGGEVRFVGRMMEESRELQGRVHWFTSMVGSKVNFRALRKRVQALPGVTAVRTTELMQGRTQRWALAWSFLVPAATNAVPLMQVQAVQRGTKRPLEVSHWE